MKKRCCSCGCTFTLSGSGKRQKYCSECAKRGDGRVWGLLASKPLNIKGAENDFSAPIPPSIREQIEAQKDQPNPIPITTIDGRKGRVWLADYRQ